EQIVLGKKPEFLSDSFKSEKVIEIQPVGTNGINIVWEWLFVDHLIQDYDNTKSNYGNVVMHPELVDFNYNETGFNHSDWLHMNSIDYNPQLDQIILSARTLGELYIIDHSTTTAEAASHTGGNQNKGGDILWRWGNPQVYRQGTATDQKLFQQHDAKWITEGYVNENKVTVFNNNSDGTGTFSSIHIIAPTLDATNAYELENDKFSPSDFFWSWSGEILGETMYQFNKSGVNALENGNILICETKKGRLTEISPNGDIAWIYRNPVGRAIHDQFATDADIFNDNNSMFRGEKYPKTDVAFIGRDLTPGDILEDVNSLSESCNSLSVIDFDTENNNLSFNNPVLNNKIIFHQELENTSISIYNALGKVVFKTNSFSGKQIELANFSPGIHFIKFVKEGKVSIEKALIK
ncbi:MAG: aryl-sulfate sulfotransferase, partial [Oceanihabitans sp.]|nr:aryl-sulfate sulfotransferase [Gammaproteobacteria bacterium]MBQ0787738.1 aryl-sulfate sulfotransferase [Oceanihabitans sp.]